MFFALTRKTSSKKASCQPRVFAYLEDELNGTGTIKQQVEKSRTSKIKDLGFTDNSRTLKWLREDHNQLEYEDYTTKSVVQSILNVSGTLDAHSDVRKFGGDCEGTNPDWGIHPNVKVLLVFISFVVQYVCIHL